MEPIKSLSLTSPVSSLMEVATGPYDDELAIIEYGTACLSDLMSVRVALAKVGMDTIRLALTIAI